MKRILSASIAVSLLLSGCSESQANTKLDHARADVSLAQKNDSACLHDMNSPDCRTALRSLHDAAAEAIDAGGTLLAEWNIELNQALTYIEDQYTSRCKNNQQDKVPYAAETQATCAIASYLIVDRAKEAIKNKFPKLSGKNKNSNEPEVQRLVDEGESDLKEYLKDVK